MTGVTGGCLCGAVRYDYGGEPGPVSICHCADCRKVTGSAFNAGMKLAADKFSVSGKLGSFTHAADSGNELTRYFCATCGSPIYGEAPHLQGLVFVRAGTLDDPTLVKLNHQSWTISAVDWAHIPPDLPAFEKGRT